MSWTEGSMKALSSRGGTVILFGLQLWRRSARGWSWPAGRCAVLVSLLGIQLGTCVEAAERDREIAGESGELAGVYEPSGALQLPDGRLLIVEDEARSPFALLTFEGKGEQTIRRLRLGPSFARQLQLEDLEGIAPGEDGYIYAITSHSRKRTGKREASRERLVRLKVVGDRLTELAVTGGLRDQIVGRLRSLGSSARGLFGLNIEGLAFDSVGNRLVIGLRSPLVSGRAVLLTIAEPAKAFAKGMSPLLAPEHWLLDLDGGGIRGLAYDPHLQGLLILSRREGQKGKRPFKLWLWRGGQEVPPRRLHLGSAADLEGAEGVTPVRIKGNEGILIVRDDGSAVHGKAAHFVLLSYPALPLPAPGVPTP